MISGPLAIPIWELLDAVRCTGRVLLVRVEQSTGGVGWGLVDTGPLHI